MLTVRKEQLAAFDDAAARRFESEMVKHLRQFAPRHSEVLGEPGVRKVIRLGMERSKQCGLTYKGSIRLYLELMFMFGSSFDTDPQLPWTARILNGKEPAEEMARAEVLHHETVRYLHRVAGPGREYAIAALHRISQTRLEDFAAFGEGFNIRALAGLKRIYPEKAADLGEPGLEAVIQRGIELARKHDVSTEQGNAVFIAGVFAIGHGFTADLLFPWVSMTLNDPAVTDPNERAGRLETRMRTYLRHALAYLQRRQRNV